MDYVIVMDVSGDLDADIARENDVRMIPMEYSLGSETLICDGLEKKEDLKNFYNSQRGGDFTKTSQISPYKYETYLKSIFEEGKSILYLCLSSGLSSTYQSAVLAKATLEEEYEGLLFMPVDTLAATGGMGVLAERAIRNKKNGMSIEDNYSDLLDAVKKIHHRFVVEDLMYLKRGGRISATTAVVGTALNIRPILVINQEGKLDTIAKKRGDKAALNEITSQFSNEYDPATEDVIYIVHADNEEKVNFVADNIRELYPESEVRIHGLSPIIGAHTGPGMIAICYIGK